MNIRGTMIMLRYLMLSATFLSVCGCTLLRTTPSEHESYVNKLNAIGVDLKTARNIATQHGYKCDSVYTSLYGKPTNTARLNCNKIAVRPICPQLRTITFVADAKSEIVYYVGSEVTEHSCF